MNRTASRSRTIESAAKCATAIPTCCTSLEWARKRARVSLHISAACVPFNRHRSKHCSPSSRKKQRRQSARIFIPRNPRLRSPRQPLIKQVSRHHETVIPSEVHRCRRSQGTCGLSTPTQISPLAAKKSSMSTKPLTLKTVRAFFKPTARWFPDGRESSSRRRIFAKS